MPSRQERAVPQMTHPDTGQRIDVRDDQAATYATQGWAVVDDKPAPTEQRGK
ncbi:MAG: hypothetical protein ACRCZP_11740 [Phycicoccus sp.]